VRLLTLRAMLGGVAFGCAGALAHLVYVGTGDALSAIGALALLGACVGAVWVAELLERAR
jgi:hypothetical protein